MTMKLTCAALLLAVLAACSTPPRVTTPEERATAMTTIALVESTVTALHVAGRLDTARFTLAQQQIGELRALVAQSADTPLAIADLTLRVTNLAVAWIPPKQDN